jgi:hypothetical protein
LCFLLLLLLSLCVCVCVCVCVWTFLRNSNNPPQLSVFIHTENDTPSVCVYVCARNPNLQTKYLTTTTTTTRDTSSKQAINEYTRTITRDSFAEDLEQEKKLPNKWQETTSWNNKQASYRYTTTTTTNTKKKDTQQQQQQETLGANQQPINKLHHNNSSQESRLQRRGHRGEQKWRQQHTLSKISPLLLEMHISFHNSLFHNNKPNQK